MRREKNILQSIWEGKKYPAHQAARKKHLADQKSPTPQELNGRPLQDFVSSNFTVVRFCQ